METLPSNLCIAVPFSPPSLLLLLLRSSLSLSQTAAVLPTTSLPNLILPKLASTLISDLIILRHRSEHVTSPSF